MNIAVVLTDDVKRAARYLEYSKVDMKAEMERQCSDVLKNLVKRAKRKYAEETTIETISPEPLE